ncbi:Cu(I)-responsive transcriptional regulator [Roseovarius sp. D0-M9]|uniref:Cu(I)-responsive transcriptional regulator n=1 Tax=Roseovarius sp. D0-M9 TaxID=3127117 RepID=UPI00300F8611
MNIGDIARITNLPAKIIRYYEDIGLVHPGRDANTYRRFNQTDVHKLGFIRRARSLGFTIEDCRALLALYEDKVRASADVKQIAQHHPDLIDAKIAELKAMRTTLGHLIENCAGDHRPDCPILEDLAVISQKEPG